MWQPIFSHDDVIGVLCVCWAERVENICARAARAVALLTDETAVALAHHDALERLAAQATTDGLTGLPNRRAWDERLARDLAAARRRQHPLTLALLDMDRFKHFNDTRGHSAGDELLREFARHARELLREGDKLARWGGEEFAVLLPDCPSHGFAESILERIRALCPPARAARSATPAGTAERAPSTRRARRPRPVPRQGDGPRSRRLRRGRGAGRRRPAVAQPKAS